jgi:dihydroneopterin aldolase
VHGYHGVHEEEKKVMNSFEINLDVRFEEGAAEFLHLQETISYVELFNIVHEEMQVPVLLLERLCSSIVNKIKSRFSFVSEIEISIYKMQAPIKNFQGKLGVSLKKKFD